MLENILQFTPTVRSAFLSSIYFLQETYSEPNDEKFWKKEWGGELFFSHGTKHSKGVRILINPTAQIQVNYSYSDKNLTTVLLTEQNLLH